MRSRGGKKQEHLINRQTAALLWYTVCSLANTSRVAVKCRAGDQQALMSSPAEPF